MLNHYKGTVRLLKKKWSCFPLGSIFQVWLRTFDLSEKTASNSNVITDAQ